MAKPMVRHKVEPKNTVATSTIVQTTDRWDASSSATTVLLPREAVNCTDPVEITGAGVARGRQQLQLGSHRPSKLLRQSLGRELPTTMRHS
mmetsp:Transcript_145144/g.368289  ORF Transcript_145144/g.368289 Transcript_145144/m.368289 type:complete len:91 (+) Transcript_145144:104-376(+)